MGAINLWHWFAPLVWVLSIGSAYVLGIRVQRWRDRDLLCVTRRWLRKWLLDDGEQDFTGTDSWPGLEEEMVAAIEAAHGRFDAGELDR